MSGLPRSVTALVALLDVDVAGLDARALRDVLQREVSGALALCEQCVSTDADVRQRAVRQARAIDAAWSLVRLELEVELGERRRGEVLCG